ncbi:threonine transporter [Mesorhizobium sp. WSM4303]|uniref:ABC-three component system middle component 2 n=1 Tax=unclassified Mesorhizobium TaxID=325217 RepID=UPI00115DE08A|nr:MULTISPECIES: ABC-three component system middle component 2 [unclassified Mesorhizobium]TRD00143.1 threonine transporter [Mesorhizobium sp. WSM4303]TRD00293.1 threonine transporter [Mesorhizobium sp. WSM4306]
MTTVPRLSPFNSTLETGMRSLAILVAAFPAMFDLHRLVEMDYLVVHSGDADGPESLHTPLPLRAGELLVRRGLIEKGLLLMMSRGLVKRIPSNDGFSFVATETAWPFISSLTADYSRRLSERAEWAVDRFQDVATEDIRRITHRLFERWSSQFQPIQSPGGSQ